MLLMVKNGIGGRICYYNKRYVKAKNKYIKIFDKKKESSYLNTIQDEPFLGFSRMVEFLRAPLPIFRYTYLTMMKLGTLSIKYPKHI